MSSSRHRCTSVVAKISPLLVILSCLLVAWQGFVVLMDVPSLILPSPVKVTITTLRLLPMLFADATVTAATALLGLIVGGIVGLALAFAMVNSRSAKAIIYPYIIGLRISPLVAIAPLLFLWFGDSVGSRSLLVATITLFPVAIASYDGLNSTPEQYLDLMHSVDAPTECIFFRVRVPAAAPSVFAGIKLSATLSVIGAVVAEFLTLQNGIGYRLFITSKALETEATFAALFVLSLLGLLFYLAPAVVENRLWGT